MIEKIINILKNTEDGCRGFSDYYSEMIITASDYMLENFNDKYMIEYITEYLENEITDYEGDLYHFDKNNYLIKCINKLILLK